ncbi:hypothetical protein [Azotobacter chroococcum]|nr:hypothetical protein [Azotobacter chroococcum]
MQAMQPTEQQDWPRDFDVRAEYAEQQELLAAECEPLPTPAQDTRNHG